ncbi:hypothetical protein RIF29_24718 [Crotalaria pallida]|uniref:Plant bHLH transcription factor ACT-like domain-containing protein n=1 Tax=Crotalaria pallida TaxID=3830 RepID=A0AAN9I0F6_CROPI
MLHPTPSPPSPRFAPSPTFSQPLKSTSTANNTRYRTKDILSVVLVLLIDIGCSAVIASAVCLVWPAFSGCRNYCFDDFDSFNKDNEIETSKTSRYVKIREVELEAAEIDKASILSEAITYVKQLQKRVKDLEEQSCCKKIRVESVQFTNKTQLSDEGSVSSDKTNSDDGHELNVTLPEVEARVLENEVLIRIHCNNQNGSMLKILNHLKSLDLSTISTSVLPFGNSLLDITIIVKMGDTYNLTVKELMKSLRVALLESRAVQH